MKKKKIVLIVDDVELNRAFLRDMLEDEYEIIEAANGLEAVDILARCEAEIAVVLLDAVMPEMNGFEVLEYMNQKRWIDNIPVVMISSETSPEFISKGYQLGAIDYISRPYSTDIVMHRVKNTIILYAKQMMLQAIVKEQVRDLEDNNSLMVDILSTIVEFRNGESGAHVQRIRVITEILLEAYLEQCPDCGLTASDIAEISNAAALHDVGKIVIPEEILNKPSKLTHEEFEVIKGHSEKGAQMIANIHSNKQVRMLKYAHDICRWHHERWDGKGYPDGLSGRDIPICAQVVALADVYDALVSKRVYKPAYPRSQAIQMIINGECGAFNKDLLDCLIRESLFLEERIRTHEDNRELLFDVEKISKEVIARKSSALSSRTVALLEQERIKNQFLASLSNEILFEYEIMTNTLTFSERGAQELGIPLRIENAIEWLKTGDFIQEEDCLRFGDLMRGSSIEIPIIQTKCVVMANKKDPKWFEVTMRIMWSEELIPKQYGCIGKLVDIHEKKAAEDLLTSLAECDPLTHLYNHATAKKKIQERLSVSGLSALIFFDIDNFKLINDTYGHLAGDRVLKNLADIIAGSIRVSDIAARVGGDEFLLFVSGFQNSIQLGNWVEKLWRILQAGGKTEKFTVSMGIAVCAEDSIDYDILLSRADKALYNCKDNGKNMYTYYRAV